MLFMFLGMQILEGNNDKSFAKVSNLAREN